MKEKNKTKKTQITEIVFILDRSGSMHGMETDTIGGFNSMLNKQKEANINAIVSTVLFDHEIIVLHDRKKINEIPLMTNNDYQPRGSTALLDAIGSSIKHISKIHEIASLEDRPTKTLFVITTDGRENDSQTYTVDIVKTMISIQKEKYNWEFVFLGADIDAISTAREIGINEKNAVEYTKDSRGTRDM
ncbi:MAG: VWA domain-containing protein [Alphaproteobacteria bacterium]|nr:VWA domain-containing protein [Alphaproteobacteria bacterium]